MRLVMYLLAGLLGCAVLAAGCSSSTDPNQDGDLEVVYSPERQFLDITVPGTQDFSVAPSRPASLSATWYLNGTEVAGGLSYRYQTGMVGQDTLTVHTILADEPRERDWLITVLPSASLLPPPVPDVTIQHGEEPMDVLVSWHWINQSTFPMVDYLVASSYEDRDITAANWDEATLQGVFPHVPGQAGYSAVFTAEEHGMLPATAIRFAIRGRDDRGQMSPIVENFRHTISFAWYIEGTVYDTELEPLPEIIIDFGGGENRVNTDVNGYYHIGPFRDIDTVTLTTYSRNVNLPGQPLTSWYDLQTDPLVYSEADNTHDLMLVTRYGMDELCNSYSSEFLNFLRHMTKTDMYTQLRENFRLFKWEEYPVRVHIPGYVRESDQLDFEENARLAMGYWNLIMGEDYLVETPDPQQAQIQISFTDLGSGANGRASLAAPQFPYYYGLGDVIPELILVEINNVVLPNAQRVQETVLHELGHALGLYEHVDGCSDLPYLMNVTSGGALDNGWQNAVHLDEVRMLRAIRYLPQGVDMGSFRLN
jgi:hypothetical protein